MSFNHRWWSRLVLCVFIAGFETFSSIVARGDELLQDQELVLTKNRGNTARFSLRNTGGRSKKLTTAYGVFVDGMLFKPDGVILQYFRGGKWTTVPNPIAGYRGSFILKPRSKVAFDVDLEYLASKQALKKGTQIRIIVDGIYSEAFPYQGD